MEHGISNKEIEHGTWNIEHGTWNMEYGISNMEYQISNIDYDLISSFQHRKKHLHGCLYIQKLKSRTKTTITKNIYTMRGTH